MVNIERKSGIDIITFSVSKINALITDEIRDIIVKLFDNSNTKVVIDLKGVEYVDSSGFGCFLTFMRTARNNYCYLKFANPEPKVMELFHALHLHTVLQIYDNIDNCLSSFE